VNGLTFKRQLKSGVTVWCYSLYAGKDEHGKPINLRKRGFETKGAASTAKRDAIAEYERTHGKLWSRWDWKASAFIRCGTPSPRSC